MHTHISFKSRFQSQWGKIDKAEDQTKQAIWDGKKLQDSPSRKEEQCYGTLCQTELKIMRASTHLKAI